MKSISNTNFRFYQIYGTPKGNTTSWHDEMEHSSLVGHSIHIANLIRKINLRINNKMRFVCNKFQESEIGKMSTVGCVLRLAGIVRTEF